MNSMATTAPASSFTVNCVNVIQLASAADFEDRVFSSAFAPLAAALESTWSDEASQKSRAERSGAPDEFYLSGKYWGVERDTTAAKLVSDAVGAIMRRMARDASGDSARWCVCGLYIISGISRRAALATASVVTEFLQDASAGSSSSSLSSALSSALNAASGCGVDEAGCAPCGLPLSASADAALLGQFIRALLGAAALVRGTCPQGAAVHPFYSSDRRLAIDIVARAETDASSFDMAARWALLQKALDNNGEDEKPALALPVVPDDIDL
jgi:hypothetical protein